jgi:hypothetical protein
MTRQTLIEHTVLERDLSDDFLQLPILAVQVFDFVVLTRPAAHGPRTPRCVLLRRLIDRAWLCEAEISSVAATS